MRGKGGNLEQAGDPHRWSRPCWWRKLGRECRDVLRWENNNFNFFLQHGNLQTFGNFSGSNLSKNTRPGLVEEMMEYEHMWDLFCLF